MRRCQACDYTGQEGASFTHTCEELKGMWVTYEPVIKFPKVWKENFTPPTKNMGREKD